MPSRFSAFMLQKPYKDARRDGLSPFIVAYMAIAMWVEGRKIRMGVELSEAEKKALDQLKKACDKRGPKTIQTLQNCALLKQQLIILEKEKTKEIETALLVHRLQQVGN